MRVFLAAWLGVLPFAAIGLLVGMVATPDSAQSMSTVTMLLFSLLGGVIIPVQVLPPVAVSFAHALPSYWLTTIAIGQANGGGVRTEGVAVVAGVARGRRAPPSRSGTGVTHCASDVGADRITVIGMPASAGGAPAVGDPTRLTAKRWYVMAVGWSLLLTPWLYLGAVSDHPLPVRVLLVLAVLAYAGCYIHGLFVVMKRAQPLRVGWAHRGRWPCCGS